MKLLSKLKNKFLKKKESNITRTPRLSITLNTSTEIVDIGKIDFKYIPIEALVVGDKYVYIRQGSLGYFDDEYSKYYKNYNYTVDEVYLEGIYYSSGSIHFVEIENDKLIKEYIENYGEQWGFRYEA